MALLCAYCHDRADNGDWGNAVSFGVYRLWDIHNRTLIERRLENGSEPEAGALGAHIGSIGENGKPTDVAASHPAPVSEPWPEEYRRDEALGMVLKLREEREQNPWAFGDLFNDLEEKFGDYAWGESVDESGQTLADKSGLKYATLRNYQRVAKRISNTRRRGIPFGHWQSMYDRSEDDQEAAVAWLLMHPKLPTVKDMKALWAAPVESEKCVCVCGNVHRVKVDPYALAAGYRDGSTDG